jgi:MinD-like ATPase involved in chromosome partitioning or flagellar assembly
MGKIITFYSYKGGVGRSMALANIGVLLTQWGYTVLLIDFDLEAPGLETFFDAFLELAKVKEREGLVDYLHSHFAFEKVQEKPSADRKPVQIRLPRVSGRLEILTAGRRDEDYFKKVTNLDFRKLYSEMNAGHFIEEFRQQLKQEYDFVLVDSRTGLTDIGGVCTVHLPDLIVFVSTATEQALLGGIDIIRRSSAARHNIPFQRAHVLTLPIPSRFDNSSELRLTQKWIDRFANELADIYAHWLPRLLKPRDILELTKLPHVPFFSYGEGLPVLDYGTKDPGGLGYAYENLAALIGRNLGDVEQFISNRDDYVRKAVRDLAATTVNREPRIFLSFSHADRRWVDRFLVHIKPLTTSRNIAVWSDRDVGVGESWREKINEEISQADVAVIFVSADYLASNWVASNELPMLLKAAEERGLRILWIAISHSLVGETSLSQFQALSDPSKPLNVLSPTARERAIFESVRRIADVAGRKY